MSEPLIPFDVEPNVNNHFAWLRTVMGLQTTLMAAVRTAMSLIGFGFTVAQFFDRLLSGVSPDVRRLGPSAPRDFGLLLIAAGVVSLAIFTWQFSRTSAYLYGAPFQPVAGRRAPVLNTASYLIAFAVIAIGVLAFASVFIRL